MPAKSKQKEGRHLREIIPVLNSWWGDTFVKTPSSGALRWKNKHWTFADLVPPEDFPFCVEAKHHKEFILDELVTASDEDLRKGNDRAYGGKLNYYWYWQVGADAVRATENLGTPIYPLLIYRSNLCKNRLIIQDGFFRKLPEHIQAQSHIRVSFRDFLPYIVVGLDTFLKLVPRQDFEKYLLGR